MQQHSVECGSLAVGYGDRLGLAKGYGGLTAGSWTLLASPSAARASLYQNLDI